MSRSRILLAAVVAATAVLSSGVALAQTRPAPEGAPTPRAPAADAPTAKEMEATVKKVDPASGTVQLSKMFGLFGATLQVTPDTRITVAGREASLADIREGATVKAAYESQGERNVATVIEVLPAADSERGARPIGSPPSPSSAPAPKP